jgi:signal transduction histidine kinase
VAAIILMVAVILSWAMARALTRPIVQLEEGARRVGGGDWSARVSEKGPGELGRLALEFNGMAKKLGVLDRMKDEFVHAVSHDLRNPLGAILASAKLLRGETSSSESQSLVEVVETSAVRLSAMVNDILDVACLQERALQFNRTVFALPPLLRELVRLYSPLAQETRKNIVLEIPPSLPSLKADEGKVFRVFLNLLANAMKFTRPGDSVTLSARSGTPGWVECRVSDTGPGIAPERIPPCFWPIVRERELRPTINAARGPGWDSLWLRHWWRGTAEKSVFHPPPDEGGRIRFHHPGGGFVSARIFIVEDDAQMRRVTKFLFERNKYKVSQAETAEDALAEISRDPPHLVIVDVHLPGCPE